MICKIIWTKLIKELSHLLNLGVFGESGIDLAVYFRCNKYGDQKSNYT